jgi:hypothetical protein
MGLNSCSVVACCSSSLHPTEGAFTAYPPATAWWLLAAIVWQISRCVTTLSVQAAELSGRRWLIRRRLSESLGLNVFKIRV